MDRIIDEKLCTGCGACSNICQKNAIKMELRDNGFVHPVIDSNKCVNCNLCRKICPINKFRENNNFSILC